MSNYTAACIIKALSRLLPKYESRTWDAKTRKLLSYQIVISGKIQYFQTFFSEAYSLKEFCQDVFNVIIDVDGIGMLDAIISLGLLHATCYMLFVIFFQVTVKIGLPPVAI